MNLDGQYNVNANSAIAERYTLWEMETHCYWCRCQLHEDNVHMYGTGDFGRCYDHRYQCELCDDFVDEPHIFIGIHGRERTLCAPCYVEEREGHR